MGRSDEKVLEIALPCGRYSLRLADVTGVAPPRALRSVPGAPESVLGLADWRGGLLTVLDLGRLIDERPAGAQPWLIRLAPPFENVALATGALPTIADGGGNAVRLDPASLVERAGSRKAADRPHGS